jgi:hypothetical protein
MTRSIPLLLLCLPALAAAERPQDFAYGIPLAVDGREPFYQVELPRAVYEGAVRADLGDVRVFNAAGEVVPHALRPRPAPAKSAPAAVGATLFPLRTDAPAGIEGLDLRIAKTGERTTVDLRTRDGRPAGGTKLVGYVADASAVDVPVRAVALALPAKADDVSARVTLEASDDLRQWTPLVHGANVLRLATGGERLESLRIEFPARKVKYLRLTWPGRAAPLELAGLAVEPGETVVEAPRQWHEVPGIAVKDEPGEFEFDLGGQLPVDRLRFALPQPNTVAVVEVLARAKPAEPWRRVTGATVYRLERDGEALKSPDIAIAGATDRYWRVKVDPRGGGIGAGEPVLGAGWVPHRLVFAARGAAPFQLAYGSREAKPAAFAIATLVPGYKDEGGAGFKPAMTIGAAHASAPRTLGGEAATRERIDWKRWTLWGSLVAAVAVLGWMALRLGRQMSKPAGPPAP